MVSVRPATVAIPLRGGDAFGFTAKVACPLPAPLGDATVIQSTADVAVHEQPGAVVTEATPLPPSPVTSRDDGSTEYVQPFACVIVNDRPAIVIVPDRAGPILAAIAICTCPLPVPVPPFVMPIQDNPPAAVHAQPAPAST